MFEDELTPEDRVRRAGESTALLSSPAFISVLGDVEYEATELMISTPLDDREARDEALMFVKAVRRIKVHLQAAVEDGRIAQAELNDLQSDQD